MKLAWMTAGAITVGAIAIAGCSSASSKASEKTGVGAADIQNGTTDTTHKYAVGVCDGTGPGQCRGICSGALILPNLIATARHCVSESPERINCSEKPSFGADKTSFYITTNPSMFGSATASTGWYKGKTVFRPDDDHVCGNDIALIQLEKSIPASEATPVIPGIQKVMWDSEYLPQFTAIGYGRTSPVGSGSASSGAGTRRILELINVQCIPGSKNLPCPSQFNAAEFVAGDGTCQGDSGSSAYETTSFQADAPVSFGVLSRGGASDDGSMCQGSLYSRFDAHRDFVLNAAKIASNNWKLYPEPSWTAYVAPPGSKTKDAGAAKTGDAVIGEECTKKSDCASGLTCASFEDGSQACAQSCSDDENACSSGYECLEGACLKSTTDPDVSSSTDATDPAALAPQTVTTTTSACSFSSGTSGSSGASALVGFGLLLAAVRRRKAV